MTNSYSTLNDHMELRLLLKVYFARKYPDYTFSKFQYTFNCAPSGCHSLKVAKKADEAFLLGTTFDLFEDNSEMLQLLHTLL